MNRRITWVCLLAATFSLVVPARAEHTHFWRQSDFADFQKGTPDGVALRSDGKLTPAPRLHLTPIRIWPTSTCYASIPKASCTALAVRMPRWCALSPRANRSPYLSRRSCRANHRFRRPR